MVEYKVKKRFLVDLALSVPKCSEYEIKRAILVPNHSSTAEVEDALNNTIPRSPEMVENVIILEREKLNGMANKTDAVIDLNDTGNATKMPIQK